MINKFFQNTRKPEGVLGKMMLRGMNTGHRKLAAWGLSHVIFKRGSHILDVGCGGGANIAEMLKKIPESIVDGLDYSAESVAYSQKTNRSYLGKRCTNHQGDVSHLPYPDGSLDYVTAFETIYFWPDLRDAFKEIKRVLRPGGELLICCEADDSSDTTWTERIEGMTIHRGEDLKELLLKTGYKAVELYRNDKGWVCLKAVC